MVQPTQINAIQHVNRVNINHMVHLNKCIKHFSQSEASLHDSRPEETRNIRHTHHYDKDYML